MTKLCNDLQCLVCLLGNGDLSQQDVDLVDSLGKPVFCADGGLAHALANGFECKGVLGDLDSVDPKQLAEAAIEPILLDDQDRTDFDKSLSHIDSPHILCFGFIGDRLDHSLAAMNTLCKHRAGKAILFTGHDMAIRLPKQIELALPDQTRFSIFPMSAFRARSVGLKWALDGLDFAPTQMTSTSNETNSTHQRVETLSGEAILILPRAYLSQLLDALQL